jgi:membrane-bound lytic murein transglycosylase D
MAGADPVVRVARPPAVAAIKVTKAAHLLEKQVLCSRRLLSYMQKPAFLLLLLTLAGPLAAQPVAPLPHPDVPAAMDVAGLHLVLNEEARRLVQQRADALCRHQPSFQARVDLADGSFPIIDKVLQQEGVPLDFRYLALQESALRGDAQSVHDAVGYWQLKQGTATDLGWW